MGLLQEEYGVLGRSNARSAQPSVNILHTRCAYFNLYSLHPHRVLNRAAIHYCLEGCTRLVGRPELRFRPWDLTWCRVSVLERYCQPALWAHDDVRTNKNDQCSACGWQQDTRLLKRLTSHIVRHKGRFLFGMPLVLQCPSTRCT